jgi:hypothetical protein
MTLTLVIRLSLAPKNIKSEFKKVGHFVSKAAARVINVRLDIYFGCVRWLRTGEQWAHPEIRAHILPKIGK